MGDLNTDLAELRADVASHVPAEIAEVLKADREGFVGVIAEAAAKPGTAMPDLTLPDASGGRVPVADGPAVVVFYRGAWCPYCNLALRTYQREVLPELENLGAKLIAVSPQLPDDSLSTKDLEFTVLSDVGNELGRALGITFRLDPATKPTFDTLIGDVEKINGAEEWELPYPTVLVVDGEGVIRFIDVHPDYTTRTDPADILAAVKAL
ncbi:peroxiredoxin-like family protein [Amycolatopsis regifaucium]|uniref:thioredoxin-dependent peroxiredoxin n=1 Tax=Amycolatopsis regifaucium TaxID=546365 RepID=A0A154MFL1_9PSEU|nr:peroxiredoxin-like family protein [Amycolatopsis regifaucium]KZB83242.1 peroxiredoxin-like protein [Amycolatopsis regifaucium]OKA09105.1 peroxiredoxin-like protein [Amycolatopsis regifaucium]SFI98809.1 Peroxiredoxin [Amycolatopsis regifaucium]